MRMMQSLVVLAAELMTVNAATPQTDNYAAAYERVANDEKIVLHVGQPAGAGFHVESLPGIAPGVYDCFRAADGQHIMRVRTPDGATEALAEVNAKRATRGLPPYIYDEGLTVAASAAASHRARHLIFGHSANDFNFLPSGSTAASAGCAAYPASYGWLSCDIWERNHYAGAAWAAGRDGKRYMHIFIR